MTSAGTSAIDPYAMLRGRVEESSGLYFPPERLPQLVAATERAMRNAGVTELDDYVTALASGRLPIADLIEEVVVGETYFFREPDQFAFLRRVVLPEITARKPAPHAVRVWSAACASGEEAYSLAILLDEVGLGDRARILGTDLSREALRKAERATYGRWSLRGSDAFRARRHLTGAGNVLALDPEIKRRVRLEQLNLTRDVYPSVARGIGSFDLVLCRNVLIYFDAATVATVARRLHAS
ncbi:MAG TPA: protein-glutamate O-methyltransferase CheR, partial [Labilithrix sp.]|nr:protein-glutamate O-methyltransferase CheR [Labilithrix sp.]